MDYKDSIGLYIGVVLVGLDWGYIGIMEKTMETIVRGHMRDILG